jgi:hypothetical protein
MRSHPRPPRLRFAARGRSPVGASENIFDAIDRVGDVMQRACMRGLLGFDFLNGFEEIA